MILAALFTFGLVEISASSISSCATFACPLSYTGATASSVNAAVSSSLAAVASKSYSGAAAVATFAAAAAGVDDNDDGAAAAADFNPATFSATCSPGFHGSGSAAHNRMDRSDALTSARTNFTPRAWYDGTGSADARVSGWLELSVMDLVPDRIKRTAKGAWSSSSIAAYQASVERTHMILPLSLSMQTSELGSHVRNSFEPTRIGDENPPAGNPAIQRTFRFFPPLRSHDVGGVAAG